VLRTNEHAWNHLEQGGESTSPARPSIWAPGEGFAGPEAYFH